MVRDMLTSLLGTCLKFIFVNIMVTVSFNVCQLQHIFVLKCGNSLQSILDISLKVP